MPDFQSHARDTFANQESARATRDQFAENAPRQAFFTTEQHVSGSGFIRVDEPVLFDCVFVEKPAFSSGTSIELMPDVTHYRYPLCDVGIYKWVTEPTPEARERYRGALRSAAFGAPAGHVQVEALDNRSIYPDEDLLWKGAYLYFHVQVEPIIRPRTDGSNLASLQARLATATGSDAITLNKLIAEAQEAQYLLGNPPVASVVYSLTWMGVALKSLSTIIDELHSDPSIPPNTPGYMLQAGSGA